MYKEIVYGILKQPDSLRSNEPEPPAGLKPERAKMISYYAIWDKKVAAFKNPFPVKHVVEVMRGMEKILQGDNDIAQYPEDFSVFKISDFDEIEGKFIGQKPEFLDEAVNFSKRQPLKEA